MKDEYRRRRGGEPRSPRPRPKAARRRAAAPTAEPRRRAEGRGRAHASRAGHLPRRRAHQGGRLRLLRAVADRLLPFLKDRPITLERLPEGSARSAAFLAEGHARPPTPTGSRASSWRPSGARRSTTPWSTTLQTLLYLVNQGTLTFHVWASRVGDLDRPDFVLFDLDPGKASFADVVAVARAVQGDLEGGGRRGRS